MNNKITPFLWFDNNAEQAAKFYASVFKNSKIISVDYMGGDAKDEKVGEPGGTVFSVTFEIEGQKFMAINGGPMFKFTEAISWFVSCKDQAEVDYFWEKLTADGGSESQCGWLKDKYGLSWQIVPDTLHKLLNDDDSEKSARVMQAMLKMGKLNIAELQKAYEGK